MELLQNKKGIILGTTNKKSIGWGIAKTFKDNGAQIGITYQDENFLKRVQPLADEINAELLIECNVNKTENIIKTFDIVRNKWKDGINFIVHSIAFSDKEELRGPYYNTTQSNFLNAMNISCYSFTAIAKQCKELMPDGGTLLTITYYGAEKVMPNYNVMGTCKAALEASVRYLAMDLGRYNIRVNAISAGPVKTVSASGIENFSEILNWNAQNSPLGRTVSTHEIGNAALFLSSRMSSGITGEVLHVDAGYNIVGMKHTHNTDDTKK